MAQIHNYRRERMASFKGLVFHILLKIGREEAWRISNGSAFHQDGATTKKALFLVKVLFVSPGLATHKSKVWEDQVAQAEDAPTGSRVTKR